MMEREGGGERRRVEEGKEEEEEQTNKSNPSQFHTFAVCEAACTPWPGNFHFFAIGLFCWIPAFSAEIDAINIIQKLFGMWFSTGFCLFKYVLCFMPSVQ